MDVRLAPGLAPMSIEGIEQIRGTRIAHLIETDGPGGAERMLATMAQAFAAGGCPGVAFLPKNREGWLGRELQSTGVEVEHYTLDHPYSPACLRELTAAFRAHRIDLAHSHEFTMAVYGAWAARSAGIPHVITMHGGRYYAGRWQRRLAMRIAAGTSARIVAVSQDLATHLRHDLHLAHGAIAVIPNGIRACAAEKPSLRRELSIPPADTIILSVGNLYEVKGHQYLIDALALLPASTRAHLVIAGRGDLADSLVERATALGVAARVHLLGLRDDIPNLLASADLFVHPSLREGLPVALLEAMLAGRAIVASDVGEIGSALSDGAGMLVPPANPEILAASILTLLDDREKALAMGERAACRARAVYSL
ncbi:MAG TPA: glycosyltransferase, partial [Gemmatimonadaceae bacterium]|nr:glycosyltransferase [Gemmatimonadaceae bacterium]